MVFGKIMFVLLGYSNSEALIFKTCFAVTDTNTPNTKYSWAKGGFTVSSLSSTCIFKSQLPGWLAGWGLSPTGVLALCDCWWPRVCFNMNLVGVAQARCATTIGALQHGASLEEEGVCAVSSCHLYCGFFVKTSVNRMQGLFVFRNISAGMRCGSVRAENCRPLCSFHVNWQTCTKSIVRKKCRSHNNFFLCLLLT